MPKIQYTGKVDIRNGGCFYVEFNDHVEALKVTPCETLGLASNCFYLQHLTMEFLTCLDIDDCERIGLQVIQIGECLAGVEYPKMINVILPAGTDLYDHARQLFKEVL